MSNSEKDLSEQFDPIIQQLNDPDSRPVVPPLAQQHRIALRDRLLSRYDTRATPLVSAGNLWRLAGSVAAVLVLTAVVVNFWLALSQNGMAVGSGPGGEHAGLPHTATPAPRPTVTVSPTPLVVEHSTLLLTEPVEFMDGVRLESATLLTSTFAEEETVQILLTWGVTEQPVHEYVPFVHLLDSDGALVAQSEPLVQEGSGFAPGTLSQSLYTLQLPQTVPPGPLQIEVGLYSAATGERLALLNGGQSVSLDEVTVGERTVDSDHAIVSGTEGNGLALLAYPQGEELLIVEEGSAVWLRHQPRRLVDGLIWQAVETETGIAGWLAADFLQFPTDYTPGEPEQGAGDAVWLISAQQGARTAPTDPLTLTVTLGVHLVHAETSTLKLLYGHPDWETQNDGRVPLDGIAEQAVSAGDGIVTLTAVLYPAEMEAIVGTDQPVLVAQLGSVVNDGGEARLIVQVLETFSWCLIDLNRTEEGGCTP